MSVPLVNFAQNDCTGISLFDLIHMDITVYLFSSLFSNPLSGCDVWIKSVIGSLCTGVSGGDLGGFFKTFHRGSSCVGIRGPGCNWVKQAKYSEN